jgi:MraZ protein
MSQFLGTHLSRLDVKGRLSVPAAFRAALRTTETEKASLILRPSHHNSCIDACPVAAFQALTTPLDALDPFGQDHDDMAATLYADAYPLEADKEGRIILPELLKAYANLSEAVAFVGMGRIFQIWEPAAAARRSEEARARARARNAAAVSKVAA